MSNMDRSTRGLVLDRIGLSEFVAEFGEKRGRALWSDGLTLEEARQENTPKKSWLQNLVEPPHDDEEPPLPPKGPSAPIKGPSGFELTQAPGKRRSGFVSNIRVKD